MQRIMGIEIGPRHELIQAFAIEVDVLKLSILLVIHVRVSESRSIDKYPLETISPLDGFFFDKFTPWMRTTSPHLSVFCYSDIFNIYFV